MGRLSGKGWAVAVTSWAVFAILAVRMMACREAVGGCGAGDMVMLLIVVAGMAAPAWFVGSLCSPTPSDPPKKRPRPIKPGFWEKWGSTIAFYAVAILIIIQAVGSGDLW